MASSWIIQQASAGVGASVASAAKNSLNGILDDEITLFIAAALNQLPRQMLMNSSVMLRIQSDLVNELNIAFSKSGTVGVRKLGPGIAAGIVADAAADGVEYYLVSRGVPENSALIVIVKYWVVLLIDDAYALYSGGPVGALATTISVSVGAILDQAGGLAAENAGAAASRQSVVQLSSRVRMQAALDDARGRHEMAAALRRQADDADRTLALTKPTSTSVAWNPLGPPVQKSPFAIGNRGF